MTSTRAISRSSRRMPGTTSSSETTQAFASSRSTFDPSVMSGLEADLRHVQAWEPPSRSSRWHEPLGWPLPHNG